MEANATMPALGAGPLAPSRGTGELSARKKKSGEGSKRKSTRRRWRRTYGVRTCPACGEDFVATHHNQRFCPPTGEDRERWKGQARSRCANKAQNAAFRGGELVVGKVGQPFDCAHCSKRCVPGGNVAPHATKFCSKRCKRAWHRERERHRVERLTGARA